MKIIFLFFFFFLCIPSFTQDIKYLDSTKTSPKAKIEDIKWIEGNWIQKNTPFLIEETWVKNNSSSMMGIAKVSENGKVLFFEICTITEENGSLVLRIRHYDEHLNAAEEKDKPLECKLVEITSDKAYFNGFTFEKLDNDQIRLQIKSQKEDDLLTLTYTRI